MGKGRTGPPAGGITGPGDGPMVGASGDPYKSLYRTPNKISVGQMAPRDTAFKFAIISDTHVDATTSNDRFIDDGSNYGYNNSSSMKRNRSTVYEVNRQCQRPSCLGAVQLGDMIEQGPRQDEYAKQQVIAWRQLWEND